MTTVYMLAIPYEGLLEPAFTTHEEAEKYWCRDRGFKMSYGESIVEVKVLTSAKERYVCTICKEESE